MNRKKSMPRATAEESERDVSRSTSIAIAVVAIAAAAAFYYHAYTATNEYTAAAEKAANAVNDAAIKLVGLAEKLQAPVPVPAPALAPATQAPATQALATQAPAPAPSTKDFELTLDAAIQVFREYDGFLYTNFVLWVVFATRARDMAYIADQTADLTEQTRSVELSAAMQSFTDAYTRIGTFPGSDFLVPSSYPDPGASTPPSSSSANGFTLPFEFVFTPKPAFPGSSVPSYLHSAARTVIDAATTASKARLANVAANPADVNAAYAAGSVRHAIDAADDAKKAASTALKANADDAEETAELARTAELAAVRAALATVIDVSVFSIGDSLTTASKEFRPIPILDDAGTQKTRKLNINGTFKLTVIRGRTITDPVLTVTADGAAENVDPVPPFMMLVAQPSTMWLVEPDGKTGLHIEKVDTNKNNVHVFDASLFELCDRAGIVTVHDEGLAPRGRVYTTVRITGVITRDGAGAVSVAGAMLTSPGVKPPSFDAFIVRLTKPGLWSVSCDDDTKSPQTWAVHQHINKYTGRVPYRVLKDAQAGIFTRGLVVWIDASSYTYGQNTIANKGSVNFYAKQGGSCGMLIGVGDIHYRDILGKNALRLDNSAGAKSFMRFLYEGNDPTKELPAVQVCSISVWFYVPANKNSLINHDSLLRSLVGDDWESAIVFVNGGAGTTSFDGAFARTGGACLALTTASTAWQHVSVVCTSVRPLTSVFGSSEGDCLDVHVGSVRAYDRALTEQENIVLYTLGF